MDKPASTLAILLTASLLPLHAQSAADGEARLPLRDLVRLLEENQRAKDQSSQTPPTAPSPALLDARLTLLRHEGLPQVHARFRVMSFSDARSVTPLFEGDLSLLECAPDDSIVTRQNNHTRLVTQREGIHDIRLSLLSAEEDSTLPLVTDCPSKLIECGQLGDHEGVELTWGSGTRILRPGEVAALTADAAKIRWRIIDLRDHDKVSAPPEPSTWTWRHDMLVLPGDDALLHIGNSRATITKGAGLDALLALPRGAHDIQSKSADLASSRTIVAEDGSPALELQWKTAGAIERRVEIQYRLPASPLDKQWSLLSPAGESARFLLVAHPQLIYQADGLLPATPPDALPSSWRDVIHGASVYPIESTGSASVSIARKPVADTETGIIQAAEWELQVEPDGAMIANGTLKVSHKSPHEIILSVPHGMSLLSCDINGANSPPAIMEDGRLRIHLPASENASIIRISFTGRAAALEPLEGTLDLALPSTPSFIARIDWLIRLPDGYQAETAGNLARLPSNGASTIHLRKNLCRNEQPNARIFYQHSRGMQ